MDASYRVLSADSHVVEPWTLWTESLPERYRDRAPRLVRDEDSDRLVSDDVVLPPIGNMAGVLRSNDLAERHRGEARWEDVPRACYDPDARLEHLVLDGIVGEVLYPTLSLMFFSIDDLDFKWAMFKVYNDWLADFCRAHPDKYKGVALIAHEDVGLAVAELERAANLGLSGVMVATLAGEGFPPYHDRTYDPLWAAAVDHGVPVSVHSATSRDRAKAFDVRGGRDPLTAVTKVERIQRLLMSLMFGGVFDRHPKLMVCSAENDAGWAADLIRREDFNFHRYRHTVHAGFEPFCEQPPSHYWTNNIRCTFMNEPAVARTYDLVGVGTLMFQTDFPHAVSSYPHSHKIAEELVTGIDTADAHRLLYQNAADLYGFPS